MSISSPGKSPSNHSSFRRRESINPDVGMLPGVKDEAYIGDALLLKLVGEKSWNVAGACAPVDPPPRIAPLILPYPKELDAGAALLGGDRAGIG